MTAEMRDKLNIDCHPLFGGLGYLMLKNFAAYFIKTSILKKNSIKLYKKRFDRFIGSFSMNKYFTRKYECCSDLFVNSDKRK